MDSRIVRAWLIAALAAFSVAVAGPTEEALRRLALHSGVQGPLVRIGLEDGHRLGLGGSKPLRVIDLENGQAVWRERFEGELYVVAEGGPREGVPSVFRVQTGAFSNAEAARAELRKIEQRFQVSGVVHHDPNRNNWRVRVGAGETRDSVQPLVERLRAAGLDQLWIAEEPKQEISDVSLRLVDASFDSFPSGRARLAVVPTAGGHVSVEGRPYRGVIELRVSGYGTVRAINWVGLESYLLGVVPAELGPEVWPELEALKAQAVAARTYMWEKRGQFEDEGYDLCAEPLCQVYRGISAEHPLSDRAIWATRGEILTWEGQPIVAQFSATCGGHTEDGGAIFPDSDKPYLKGVPCRAENEALASLRGTLEGGAPVEPVFDVTGPEVTRDWVLLRVSGVLQLPGARLAEALQPATLRGWTTAMARLAGRPEPQGPPGAVGTLAEAAESLLADLGWSERAATLLSEPDLPALLRDDEVARQPTARQRALAYLAWVEGLYPYPDGRFGVDETPVGSRLVPALARFGERYKVFGLRDGVVSGVGKNSLRFVQGKGEIRLPVAPRPYLFGRAGGKSVSVERLEIWPGDRVRFRTDANGAVDLLELAPPVKGASDDRSAAVYSWEERKTRRQLEAAVNQRVSVGRLRDLQVLRRGVSGRVVELRVVGTRGSQVVRGFDIRRLLDLRDLLTVIEIQRDAAGEIRAVVFAGKGWGHGVGLCQVGAYGMALRGKTYREILSHYYRGARLTPLQP